MVKCNIDRACWGKSGICAFAFCIRNDKRGLVFAKVKGLGETTNIEVEVVAIRKALIYYREQNLMGITMETDSLTLKKMINRQ